MYKIEAIASTVVKTKLLQSSQLSFNEKFNLSPGALIYTPTIIEKPGQHWEIQKDGKVYYVYHPHFKIENMGIELTEGILQLIFPYTNSSIFKTHVKYLNEALGKYKINLTKTRLSYFLAQIGHESGGFRYSLELASGEAYNNRKDLGNIYPGDGPRFKGRGWIQLTGRANYSNAGKQLGVDLVSNPELARDPRYNSAIACWFWNSRNLNFHSDKKDFEKVTRLINGGLNGWQDRLNHLQRIEAIFQTMALPNT